MWRTLVQQEILNFWFKESTSEQWFTKDSNFDRQIKVKFLKIVELAIIGKLDDWANDPYSCLALIITLDQFPRNLFRNNKLSFENDPKALKFCKHAIENAFIEQLAGEERLFALLPLIHSEDIKDHDLANKVLEKYLLELPSFERTKKAWNDHTAVIKRFGHYPHRNKILRRKSSEEEIAFLKEPNSSW